MVRTIFDQYGGFGALRKVVAAFYDKVLESELTSPYFADVNMQRLVDHQTKFVASITGGPVDFSDEVIARAHRSLHVSAPAFAEIAVILRETLEEFGLADDDIEIVCAEFLKRRNLVVTAPA